MNQFEVVKYLSNNFGKLTDEQITSACFYCEKFKELFGFDFFETVQIINKSPALLQVNKFIVEKNIVALGKAYNIKSFEFKSFVLKNPKILIYNAADVSRKLEILKTVFNCTFLDLLKKLYVYPELMNVSKSDIENKIKMLCKEFDSYGLIVRKLFGEEPRLLFVTKKRIDDIKKFFMKFFGLNELEVVTVLKVVPSILFEEVEELSQKFGVYYPAMFIKRDIKEILACCPEFVTLKPKDVEQKIVDVSKFFEINFKKACEFVRRFPNILFFDNVSKKLQDFVNLGISKKYLLIYPTCLNCVQVAMPVKFLIARILGLENEFVDLIKEPLFQILSRFTFLQQNKIYEHKDLLLQSDEFKQKYKSLGYSIAGYQLDYNVLYNICNFYIGLKDKLVGWKDIQFPALKEVVSFVNNKVFVDAFKIQKTTDFEKNKILLNSIKLTDEEISFVINKCSKSLCSKDFSQIIFQLLKFDYSLEEIINLLFNKPYIFSFSIGDFVLVVDEIMENQKVNPKQAIENLL